ncbi:hypothetical protein CRYUN_Cryun20dG0080800 [Craigia yunnanensis]
MEGESFEGPNADETPEDLAVPPQPQEPEKHAAGGDGEKWPGWPGENVFRMLVPAQKVGSIIGRKGEFIKKISEESRARIKILDAPPATSERVVMVSAKEEPEAPIPPAMDGVLRIHRHILGVDSDTAHATSGTGGRVITRLLVADTQAGSLIGRQGSMIKSIQDASNCTIRVLGKEHLPVFSLKDDSVVEIEGEPTGVHTAVELITSHLRNFLVHRSIVGVFEMQMQMPNVIANQNMVTPQSWGHLHGFPMNADAVAHVGSNPQYMHPQSQFDDFYAPHDLPLFDKHSRQSPPVYGRHASMGGHSSNVQAKQSIVTKVQFSCFNLLFF